MPAPKLSPADVAGLRFMRDLAAQVAEDWPCGWPRPEVARDVDGRAAVKWESLGLAGIAPEEAMTLAAGLMSVALDAAVDNAAGGKS